MGGASSTSRKESGTEGRRRPSATSEDGAAPASQRAGDGEAEEEEMGFGAGLAKGYEDLVNAIIRPPRMTYDPKQALGTADFAHCGKKFVREDVELKNSRGLKLQCSWWKFHPDESLAKKPLPCVIYLHGNAGCRIAAFELLSHLLQSAITVFALDFSGSGLSEGEYVSLGYFEREDVEAAIAYLRQTGQVSTVGLWGHSMGATTALLYGDRDPSIAAMVLDSPFADLMQLANELAQGARESGLRVPIFGQTGYQVAVSATTMMIRRSVRRRAGFDPQDVSPLGNCDKCFIPALFAHGEKDAFISPSHSQQLHTAYAGDKNLILFDGDHNSSRPAFFFNSAVIFLRQTLMVQDEDCLSPKAGGGGALFEDRRAMVRQSEEEMMRQAMMLSLADGSTTSQGRGITVSAADLAEGVQAFMTVAGIGGTTAQYYVHTALSRGQTVASAIDSYFDSGCTGPPSSWRCPVSA